MFRSTPTSFFATLYNLNYNIPIEKVLIDPEKIAVEGENVLIASDNLLIEAAIDSLNANKNTKENAKKLFAHMSFDGIFGRNDIMEIVNISITAVGNLINKLKEAELIESVTPSCFAIAETMVSIRSLQAWSISAKCLNSVPSNT